MKYVLVYFLLIVSLLTVSCNEGYDFSQASLGLGLRDYSCTEAWIEVQIGSNDKTTDIYIKKNDEIIKTIKLAQSDSLFYFDSLQPNTAYKFDAVTYEDGKEVKSNPVTFTTLDTTSHSFTWQTFEFGQHSSSVLYDVAIIDENNIWAVGEIYMNDSLGNPDPICYNAVHWDGHNWEINKISVTYNGNQTIAPLKGVFVLPSGEIIFSSGLPYLTQGNGWKLYHLWDMGVLNQNDGSVYRIWGTSINDLYFVGNKGTIVHYQNGSWKKIESGTTTDIQDILGYNDNFKNVSDVYCAVSYVFQAGDRKIIHIKNNKVDSLNWQADKRINSIWTKNNRIFYAAGDGVFENKKGYWSQVIDIPPYYSNKIRGNDLNDIFVCGDFGLFAHFGGTSWKTYNELYIQGIYYSISAKNNIVITVGFNGSKAIIIKGTRT